ncbi:MAG: hypothetical protein WCK70_05875 [Chloroflexales bacterium]|jgi:hypothetical protein
MISIQVNRGVWNVTLADGRKLSGRCATSGEALRAASRAAILVATQNVSAA